MSTINIGIVDDYAIVRTGLKQFLSDHDDMRVTMEGRNGREALVIAKSGAVDVLLMDISMPQQSGIDALQDIRARFPDLPVLVLSGFAEAHYATTLLRLGATGYLNKECQPEEIVEAIRTAVNGRRYISPAVAELLADSAAGVDTKLAHDALSERELQVFLRLAKGETVGHIAENMFLSVKTVSTYRTRVLEKLKLASNADLTYYAIKNGLIQ
jgi:two-component system, NarL family, invasion response regulator UvrY